MTQMEFVMLDAYERITLEPGARGLFKKTFTVPDTYGIFKFRVHYRRPGYTVLSFSTQVGGSPHSDGDFEDGRWLLDLNVSWFIVESPKRVGYSALPVSWVRRLPSL